MAGFDIDLGGQVFEDGGVVDGWAGADALGVAADPADRELEVSLDGAGDGDVVLVLRISSLFYLKKFNESSSLCWSHEQGEWHVRPRNKLFFFTTLLLRQIL